MAFTRTEFLRGAMGAWGWYLLTVAALSVVWFPMLPIALLYATPVSFVAVLVWSPFAYVLGTLLRSVRRIVIHVVAFGLFGAVIGAVTMLVFIAAISGFDEVDWSGAAFFAPYALTPALTVPFAWWRTARRALRIDRDGPPVPRRDPDAAAEDAVVIRLTERTDEFDAR
ncbi:MAG TPA: hypothetical protein DHW40_04335 [Microbacterium sp.]|nr:hypothetical protein [Microbacterium sp.]